MDPASLAIVVRALALGGEVSFGGAAGIGLDRVAQRVGRWRRLRKLLDDLEHTTDWPEDVLPISAAAVRAWLDDPGVHEALAQPLDPDSAIVLVERFIQHWSSQHRGLWAVTIGNRERAVASAAVEWFVLRLAEYANPRLLGQISRRSEHALAGEIAEIRSCLDDLWQHQLLDDPSSQAEISDLRAYLEAVVVAASQRPGLWWPAHAPTVWEAFVPARVTMHTVDDPNETSGVVEDRWQGSDPPGDSAEIEGNWADIGAELRIVTVVGNPGAGKTWLARAEAATAALEALSRISGVDDAAPLNTFMDDLPPIPLWVTARRLAERPDADTVWVPLAEVSMIHSGVSILPMRRRLLLAGLLADWAARGSSQFLVVIDGVDETHILDALADRIVPAVRAHRKCRLRVMSRHLGLDPRLDFRTDPDPDTSLVELLPLNADGLAHVIDSWFPAPDDPRGDALRETIGASDTATELAQIPLFATSLCVLATTQDLELPQTRAGLIGLIIDTLLKGVHRSDSLRRDESEQSAIRARAGVLAWQMATEPAGWSHASTESQRRDTRADIRDLEDLFGATGGADMEQEWLHPSIQEYLCAYHLATIEHNEGTVEALNALARRWWNIREWSEVTAYAAATLRDPLQLINRLRAEDLGGHLYPLLAGLAAGEASLPPATLEFISSEFVRLLFLPAFSTVGRAALAILERSGGLPIDWQRLTYHNKRQVVLTAARRLRDKVRLSELASPRDREVAEVASERLIELVGNDQAKLAELVHHRYWGVVVRAVARLDDEERVSELIRHPDWRVGLAAARRLVKLIGDNEEQLTDLTHHDDWRVVESAAEKLGQLVGTNQEKLLELTRHSRWEVVAVGIPELNCEKRLTELTHYPISSIVLAAARRLVKLIGDNEKQLTDLTHHDDRRVAEVAARGLVRLIGGNEEQLTELIRHPRSEVVVCGISRLTSARRLLELTHHDDRRVVLAAANRLVKLTGDNDEQLAELTHHDDRRVAEVAARTVVELAGSIEERLIELSKQSADERIAAFAAMRLARITDDEGILKTLTNHNHSLVRANAASTLTQLPGVSEATIIELTRSRDSEVVQAAISQLKNEERLIELTLDRNRRVVQAAIGQLENEEHLIELTRHAERQVAVAATRRLVELVGDDTGRLLELMEESARMRRVVSQKLRYLAATGSSGLLEWGLESPQDRLEVLWSAIPSWRAQFDGKPQELLQTVIEFTREITGRNQDPLTISRTTTQITDSSTI